MNSLVLQFNSSFPGDQHDPNRPPPWPRPRFASGFGEAAAFTFGAAAGFPQCPKTKAIICHILGSWDLGNSSSLAPPKSSVFYVWIQPEPKKTGILKPAHGRTPPDTTRRQRQHFWPNFSNLQVNHAQCSTISMRPGRPALFKFFCATSVQGLLEDTQATMDVDKNQSQRWQHIQQQITNSLGFIGKIMVKVFLSKLIMVIFHMVW